MQSMCSKPLVIALCLSALIRFSAQAQSNPVQPTLDYYELKAMLLKQKATVASMLGVKQFKLTTTKERAESSIYVYNQGTDTTQVLIRVRKSDGLVSEVAWHEGRSTLGSLKHDAVYDGFVPVAGNSRYYNRAQKMALYVNYLLAEDKSIPCLLKTVD